MFLLQLWGWPERPAARVRTRLSLLALDDRAAPSSLTTSDAQLGLTTTATADVSLSTLPGGISGSELAGDDPRVPANLAPQIVDFSVLRLDSGMYRISGRVLDESPGGLVVNLGGIPSVQGLSMTTNADGTFSIDVALRTDGSDAGPVTAVTRDAVGLWSNVASYWVDPK